MNVKKLIANGDLIDINKKQRRYFIIKSQEEILKIGKKLGKNYVWLWLEQKQELEEELEIPLVNL